MAFCYNIYCTLDDLQDPLHLACENGCYQTVETLLNHGYDVNETDDRGQTPLMWACAYGHTDIAILLLSRGAQINIQKNDGYTALMVASQSGHRDLVNILIEKRAQVNRKTNTGWSALMLASQKGHGDVVEILVEKGAQVNMQTNHGWSALILASQNGHSDVGKVLIEKGAQVNMQDIDGLSALMAASQCGHSDFVKVLIEKGAQVNMQKNGGLSALALATHCGHSDVVKALIEKGAQVNLQKNDGRSALISASIHGRKEVVQILLDHHADTSIRDTLGKTALSWAYKTGHTEIVELLLSFEHKDTTSGSTDLFSLFQSLIQESPELSLKVLSMELKTVTDPIQLGVGLGVAQHHLEIIKKNNPQDIEQQQLDLFSFIAKNYIVLGITWERIADTLEELVGMGDLAQEIRSKYNIVKRQIVTEGAANKEYISDDLVLFNDKPIGSGAFGTVFKGELNGQPCAIKLLHAVASEMRTKVRTAKFALKDSVEKFRKECDFFESFRHPNIVRHLATKKYPKTNHLVLALELMDCNLRQYFTPQADKEPIKLSLTIQTGLCHDIASALKYIHLQGVVHRDLCGENILLSCGGETPVAKVCDFGMSRIIKSDTRSVSLQAFAHKGYMPPEATDMESSCYNSMFDIFSFGALMVQIVRHLLTIKDRKERKYELQLIKDTHPIKELIIDCLNKNRDDRPSAAHLKRTLHVIYLE